ncbi:MAG: glutathione S-transferase family protein [Devosia sp.]
MTEKLILWGRKSSCNVQKTLWALQELDLAHEHIDIGGVHGGLDDPAYRALNPNGLVPTLQDGDLTVWESHAIVRYLAGAYGQDSLWHADPRRRALVDQWTDWTATTFQPAWINLFWLSVRTPPEQHDKLAIAEAYAKTLAAMTLLDRQLANHAFIANDALSYADIVAGVAMFRWFTMANERPAMPALEAWYGRLQQREAFRSAVMISYQELVGRLEF